MDYEKSAAYQLRTEHGFDLCDLSAEVDGIGDVVFLLSQNFEQEEVLINNKNVFQALFAIQTHLRRVAEEISAFEQLLVKIPVPEDMGKEGGSV